MLKEINRILWRTNYAGKNILAILTSIVSFYFIISVEEKKVYYMLQELFNKPNLEPVVCSTFS